LSSAAPEEVMTRIQAAPKNIKRFMCWLPGTEKLAQPNSAHSLHGAL
jgi:hypothetical protein